MSPEFYQASLDPTLNSLKLNIYKSDLYSFGLCIINLIINKRQTIREKIDKKQHDLKIQEYLEEIKTCFLNEDN